MSLDKIKIFEGVDLSACLTTDEKVKKVLTNNKEAFDVLFELLDENEKEKYYKNLNVINLEEYLSTKSDEFIFKFITTEYMNFNNSIICDAANLIKDENLKYKFIVLLIDNMELFLITDAIKMISTETQKLKLIKLLLEKNNKGFILTNAISSLNDDQNKLMFINYLDVEDQIIVIKSLKNKNLIKEYLQKEEDDMRQALLIEATKDKEFIKEKFLNAKDQILQNNLINLIDDKNFKIELIKLIKNENVKQFHLSNCDDFYNDYMENVDRKLVDKAGIDPCITIGVELECCNKDIKNYLNIKSLLKYFDIVIDESVNSGLEVISPILNFTSENMGKLKSVCEILKKCGFYTDDSCGGHIHIGADYLKNTKEMYMLLYIYSNCEHIIYQICNKKSSKMRRGINHYAKTIKKPYLDACQMGYFKECLSKEDFINTVKEINKPRDIDKFEEINISGTIYDPRHIGLNLENLNKRHKNTIEFRMPNGEINFDELIINIKLFAKIIQRTHEIANVDKSDAKRKLVNLLSNHMLEKDRLEILLTILFDSEEEKDIYRKRYEYNTCFLDKFTNKFSYKIEPLIEIDEDNKCLSRKK